MTLAQLRYLVAVSDERSFREAAARCFVTQPALSMQVRKLEDGLGVRVFDRSRQPVVPTELGERILAQARAVLREADRMADIVAESAGPLSGRYRLGILPTLAPTLLPLFVPSFARRHPLVELVIEEVQTDPMLERLRADALDGGIAATGPLAAQQIDERPLLTARRCSSTSRRTTPWRASGASTSRPWPRSRSGSWPRGTAFAIRSSSSAASRARW
jgi:LysR family hydrogen peroxide-inducible transcriptional activator